MSIEIIGTGNVFTGSSVLIEALEILGFDPSHRKNKASDHGHSKFWVSILGGETFDFDEVFGLRKFNGSINFPSGIFWKEQLRRNPNAKVILTILDSKKWYKSICDSGYFAVMMNSDTLFHKLLFKVIIRDFYHNDICKDNVIKCFEQHNAKVIAECPKEKLLVFEVSKGWEPLCKFLNKPIPSVPFPNVNDTKSMQKKIKFMSIVGYTAMALPVVLLTVGAGSVWWFTGGKGLNLKEIGGELFSGLKSSDL